MTTPVKHKPDLLHVAYLGILRGGALFPFEHPLELLRVSAQANPKLSVWQLTSMIVKEKGLLGFTNTMLTNFPKRILRESVRWPVISSSQNFLVTNFPNTFTKHGTRSRIGSALSVALFDSLFILPYEQLMAYRIKRKQTYTTFFKERFVQDGVSSLYKGLSINLFRQAVVWCTVLGMNNEAKKQFDAFDTKREHPILRQVFTSSLITGSTIAWCLPIDFIKTRVQMDRHFQRIHPIEVARILIRENGVKCLYAGTPAVVLLTLFHVTIGGMILDQIDK